MLFEKPGKQNTEATVQAVISRARELGIKQIVVSSNTGYSAGFFLPYAKEFQIVIIGQVSGFHPGVTAMSEAKHAELRSAGMQVYHTTHVLSGAERGISARFQGVYPVEIIAHSLRMLGPGVKVSTEISIMALDGGLIAEDTDIIAVGGTGGGLDTAVVIRPAHAQKIFDTKIQEIICKPYLG